ncbi:unnamed protein product [Sordaria macrospora k-hell]|uniref:WGS project CABT00000000 data, contig 2.10 n=2 Tax=Sordaria macrospora TaxID=5147 RepID=F7VWG1_SORMK|nr:uncharacterized protein SMAC_03287 [Sordaria macrospora k-hell]CCC09729.1 unnamed protein product [Sordaria macrospora k-hell]
MDMNPVSDGSGSRSSSASSSSSSTDSNETIKMPLLPHEQFTLASPWASESSMGSPSSTSMARKIQIAKNRRHRHPLLRDLEHMECAAEQYGYTSSILEPELQIQYEQGSWFPSSSSSTGTTTIPPSNNQRHWGEFCASPELLTPLVDDEVRRSLQPLFDMEIFGDGNDESSDDNDMEGLGACANNETETDIVSSLEEGYLPPPATETQTQICDDDEAAAMKRSESLISFKDLNIPPPKAPAAAPIAALKRRVSYACETATGVVKGSKAAAATSSFVGNLFDYLIEKGF